jgi:hypothetical protein
MRRLFSMWFAALLVISVAGCSGGSDGSANEELLEAARDFEAYDWSQVAAGNRWQARAGLQAVELDNRFYVLGGRSPRAPMGTPIPGDSDLWADVWTSDDQGVSWQQVLETDTPGHWPARAYFQAVVLDSMIYVLGGQDFKVIENTACAGAPPQFCPPFIATSNFFNDVWRSPDGISWEQTSADAGWSKRAGLSSVVLNDEIYVMGGSQNDDSAIVAGPSPRIYFNDVWKSADGSNWTRLTDNAAWAPRAGAVLVVKDNFLYLLGGEDGFTCEPLPGCEAPYFNDVWRSADGENWELVTASAAWVARPGHQCGVIQSSIICFGGFGLVQNPVDVWVSEDGAAWRQLSGAPWNAQSPEDIKYDFDAFVINPDSAYPTPAIYTFGGDRETFDFSDPLNYLRVDDDVWRFALP